MPGGILSIKLTRETTHLVSALPAGQKYEKALEWGVSVIRDTWLFAMGRSGQRQPEAEHRHVATPLLDTRPALASADKAGSASNMSMVSELDEPVDFARMDAVVPVPVPSLEVRKTPSQPPISPSRMLKLTPTHIDDPVGGEKLVPVVASAGGSGSWKGSAGQPLSPPKPERERQLNSASLSESIESRIFKTISGQQAAVSSRDLASPAPGAIPSGGGTGKNKDVTDVLRQLAQTEQTTPAARAKIVSDPRICGACG